MRADQVAALALLLAAPLLASASPALKPKACGLDLADTNASAAERADQKCWSRGECVGSVCVCDPGFGGPTCRLATDDRCPSNCAGHGSCNELNGTCTCHANYTGAGCDVLVEDAVSACPDACSGHGYCDMTTGVCTCDAGFVGPACAYASSDATALAHSSCPSACSGHGRCQFDGTCDCFDGFAGAACDELKKKATSKACPEGCSGHGYCDHAAGICRCVPGFGGDACGHVVPTLECEDNCSGHGSCRASSSSSGGSSSSGSSSIGPVLSAGCDCKASLQYAWQGASCDRLVEPEGCPNGCSGQGVCVTSPGGSGSSSSGSSSSSSSSSKHHPPSHHHHPGHCECRFGFSGSDCSTVLPCPASCNGRGDCVAGQCECEKGWKGYACEAPRCIGDCSGHGKCLPPMAAGAWGSCLCAGGWAGIACDVWRPHCPNDCSSHGQCVDGRCECEAGSVGDGCETREGAAPVASLDHALGEHSCGKLLCSGHGACVHGRADDTVLCACFDGYGGARCQQSRR